MITDVRDTAPEDETGVRPQPSLTSSSGAVWLIVGGLLATTGIAVLALMTGLGAPGIAITGISLILLLYAAILVVRLSTRRGRGRLIAMGWLMGAIAAVALVCVGIITALEWGFIA